MTRRRGRPRIDDTASLRRVAKHIVDMEEKGAPCSPRAAILRTSSQAPGNSSDATLWRLQRKWRWQGPALLAEERQRRARRSELPRAALPTQALEQLRRTALPLSELARAMQTMEELRRAALPSDELRRAIQTLEELRRTAMPLDELTRAAEERRRVLRDLGHV